MLLGNVIISMQIAPFLYRLRILPTPNFYLELNLGKRKFQCASPSPLSEWHILKWAIQTQGKACGVGTPHPLLWGVKA